MNNETINHLQFDRIIEEIQTRAIGDYSKKRIAAIQPQSNLATVRAWQKETQEARLIIDSSQHVPFMGLSQIDHLISQVKKGMLLAPPELVEAADFLRSSRMITKFFEKNQYQTPLLYNYAKALPQLLEVEEEIYQKIHNHKVSDDASKNLRRVRKQINETESEIQDKLLKFLRHPNNKTMLQEALIIKKGEHYTVPIKASYKNKIAGTIVEQSGNGQTAFIEPNTVSKLNERHAMLKAEETAEEYQVLAELTGLLAENEEVIDFALETITAFDIIFARAKYSRDLNGITPDVNKSEVIQIKKGRHPFLPKDAVPLDFSLGEEYRGLVITGANAGGKTVVLKTVGLLTLMTMVGLQIPAQAGTKIAVLDDLFVDIGDQQNMENALSTFSGHMHNIAQILNKVKRNTLILLDEIGSGTEPNEGAALAVAIMESMYEKGGLVVATTHYGEIKRFAEIHEDFVPAAMAFDRDTLTPKYKLQVGEIGDSQALWIAKKMHMSKDLIKQAQKYIDQKDYRTAKQTFAKTEEPSLFKKEKEITLFQKGDRVQLTETEAIGLVYHDEGASQIEVLVNEEISEVPRQRVKLLMSAQELYPADYDLDSLFIDYHTRKKNRDLDRGSKQAQKQLDKEMRERRSNIK
ncbi:endonuclease MutS2 [Enterococcus sp. 669A]|uniref:Endonuclease MutS2 n=1 Tax=Candidatus Enterococcus moelleringii TaxID=2815325 RepID=A0ABS3L5Y4_9ENTE|nr:endonuclease MutS2 [Enterococcus sp. 669A]MBO1305023.1 endonuclease MutS2 [Enterococcus sp. 669A]